MVTNIFDDYKDLPGKLIDDVKKEISKGKINNTQLKLILDRVKKGYEDAKIDAGEAIGVVTAESFGEPSTQMCTSGNEKVIFKFKNKIKIMKIGEFVDKVFEKVKIRINDDYEIYNVSDKLLVLGLDKNEKLKWSKVLALNRVKAPNKLINIKTRSGRSITATDFHSFVTRKNNKIISIAGKDLYVGNRIPIMKYLPENCIFSVAVNDYMPNFAEREGMLYGKTAKAKTIPSIFKLDKLFGWFIGAYLAEGHATNHQVNISNINEEFISNARKFIKNIGLDYKEFWGSRGFAIGRDFRVSSTLLAGFIISICNSGSENKRVPDFAYNAKEDFVSSLLKGYFDGDGNISVNRKLIRVSSNSEELIDGIKLLLTRFGIFANKCKDKKQRYLLIPYKYAPLFLEKIGSDIEHKRKALEKLADLAKYFWNKRSFDYTDMISGFGSIFYDVAKKLGIRTRYINNFTKRQRIGRTTLFRYIKKFERVSKEINIDIENELKIMKNMFYSDVIWDEIINIEYVDYSGKYVYDLSVPELETFTTFDGVVTHNTLNVKHFAGVAEMNVTMGLPRLIEIFDARKKPSTPTMEIYLKKGHTKDVSRVKRVAAQIKETIFENLATEFSIDIMKMHVKVELNKERMRDLGITSQILLKILNESLKGVSVRMNKNNEIVLKGKHTDLNEVYTLKEKAKGVFVKGVKGITYVLPFKRGDEFIISTAGTNLKEVLKIDEVDENRTVSNDIYEIYSVLGVEAARQAIINEARKVIENQGLDVDIRHILFIGDIMTTSGGIRGVTRSGITGKKESVLARASFETPLTHLINAALTGEEDKLNSVIENVILNQPVPIGTGLPDLIVKMKGEENE